MLKIVEDCAARIDEITKKKPEHKKMKTGYNKLRSVKIFRKEHIDQLILMNKIGDKAELLENEFNDRVKKHQSKINIFKNHYKRIKNLKSSCTVYHPDNNTKLFVYGTEGYISERCNKFLMDNCSEDTIYITTDGDDCTYMLNNIDFLKKKRLFMKTISFAINIYIFYIY